MNPVSETQVYKNINQLNCLLLCSICFLTPSNPVKCNSKCIFIMCKKCAIRQNSSQINCQKCKQPHNYIKLDKLAQFYFSQIGIQCNLCKLIFNSLSYQKHYNFCQQSISEQSQQLKLKAFLKNIINLENIPVDNAQTAKLQQSEEDLQKSTKLAFCSLCNEQLLICDVYNHFNICPNLVLKCDYECKWVGQRHKYIDHLKVCILNQHELEIRENEHIDLQKNFINMQLAQVMAENQFLFEKFKSDREVCRNYNRNYNRSPQRL